ncbi:MAG TPA: deoxyribonuclease IV [Desulfobulbaceae bacterium]|nr:deoxyribonuclease IV [Desulfobulbaceae bacterium]
MPYLGAHESTAGGLHLAFARIASVGGEALQIFTRNQRQWQAPPLTGEEIALFRRRWEQTACMPVASHASYLINLGSGDHEQAARSVRAFAEELHRCDLLGIPWVVIHPGSHGGDGVKAGMARVVRNLDAAITVAGEKSTVRVLLETTAGQGSGLGSRFEELGWMISHSSFAGRLGVCLDTCHIFAGGYDIRTPAAYTRTMAAFDRAVGLERLYFFHLNDSKKDLGSRVDRHEHIGRGRIGLEGFRQLLNDPCFAVKAMTLETPKGNDLVEDKENLRLLRSLLDSR